MGASEKRALRARLKAERRELGPVLRGEADAAIAARVRELPEWEAAPVVLAYLSMADEVDTRGLVRDAWAAGKRVAAPRVAGERTMEWRWIWPNSALETGPYGIEEPLAGPGTLVDATELPATSLALVPGLAFDAGGHRLGYGGGFYDAFLGGFTGASVGLCREASLVESLTKLGCLEPHDLAVSFVVTDARTVRA
jgi:5-formyltetrahydrofolate cyclo-ligase